MQITGQISTAALVDNSVTSQDSPALEFPVREVNFISQISAPSQHVDNLGGDIEPLLEPNGILVSIWFSWA